MSDGSINVLAGLEGLLSGIQSVYVPVMNRRITLMDEYNLKLQQQQMEEQAKIREEGRAFKSKAALIPLQEESDIRIAKQKPITPTYLLDAEGNVKGQVGGKVSRQPMLSSTMQKKTDQTGDAKWVISEIDRILPLNEKSSGGFFGGLRQKGMSALNIKDEKFTNTADVVNSARSLVARVLKSTFGGQLSDSEREYLNSVYGAMPNYSVEERRIALTNVQRMMQNKLGNNISGTPPEISDGIDFQKE